MKEKAPSSTECCPFKETDILGCPKLTPQLCCELRALIERHKKIVKCRKRIHELAEPMKRCKRYRPKCPCPFKRKIEFVREKPMYTRTEQLALVSVRRLLLFKNTYGRLLSPIRMEVLNRHIRTSLLSLYSRLSGAEPPKPIKKIHKWTPKEWKMHRRLIKKLAKPKKPIEPPKMPKLAMPFEEMERYKELCQPNIRQLEYKKDWHLTPEIKFFSPSKRLLELAKPHVRTDEAVIKTLSWHISDEAKAYKPSKRLLNLAMPRDKKQILSDFKENPFAIAPNALKYKASERIEELAEPKEYENTHIRENPTAISPTALTYKPTPRILELAQPKSRA